MVRSITKKTLLLFTKTPKSFANFSTGNKVVGKNGNNSTTTMNNNECVFYHPRLLLSKIIGSLKKPSLPP